MTFGSRILLNIVETKSVEITGANKSRLFSRRKIVGISYGLLSWSNRNTLTFFRLIKINILTFCSTRKRESGHNMSMYTRLAVRYSNSVLFIASGTSKTFCIRSSQNFCVSCFSSPQPCQR